jgi:anthranilate synthase component 1
MPLLTNKKIHLKPLYRSLLADTETPLSIYLKLASGNFGSYLFESVVGGEKWARYSMVGIGGGECLKVIDGKVELWENNQLIEAHNPNNPLDFIQNIQQKFTVDKHPKLPQFSGGLVGYFGYETIRYIEPKLNQAPLKKDAVGVPDCILHLSIDLVVFDNHSHKLFLITHSEVDNPESEQEALKKLDVWEDKLKNSIDKTNIQPTGTSTHYHQEYPQKDFQAGVNKIKDYIIAGDVMQTVLSQRMSKAYAHPPIDLYRAIRHINPSPYMYFMEYGDFQIVGASPEILVRMEEQKVTVRPIAGTRKRGTTEQHDQQLEQELLNDAKEVAEHLMLIDLGRNDIGRICQNSTVTVTEQMMVERYSHVMHIVSNVEGKVKEGTHPIDALKATFPAGTLSGAPKIRALEIINELEPTKRGIYSGAIGYIGWHNNIDTAIAIRTAVIKDNTLYVQAGAGIVADSIEEKEWEEAINKATAIFKAAELSENDLKL